MNIVQFETVPKIRKLEAELQVGWLAGETLLRPMEK
jgi:hypothetical protein